MPICSLYQCDCNNMCKVKTTCGQIREHKSSTVMKAVIKKEVRRMINKALLHISGHAVSLTYVLLVVLALSSHGLLWSAATVLRAPTQAVRHTVHLLQRFEPTHTGEEGTCMLAGL